VLTGSTNWTTSGLCTQLNNVLIVEDPDIAARYLDQWGKLVAAGNDMQRGSVIPHVYAGPVALVGDFARSRKAK
jgi:phosphatidylserine/phosphatidylglycerophosphate/cardiolipin synthase-like enzyme